MRNLILTFGLLLVAGIATSSAGNSPIRGTPGPALTEGRAAYVTPPVPNRFNDFGPDFGRTLPNTKAG
jgi:hypothetical protein